MRALRSIPPAVIRGAQIAVALAMLVWLWHAADGTEAARRLAGADPTWLIAALASLSLQTVLSALRWRLTAAQLGIVIDRGTAVREYYLSQIVNQTLPGGVLGDAGRALRARAQAGLLASGQAVVFERLAGQIAMFAVMALAFGSTLAAPGGLIWPGWLAALAASLVLAGLALPVVLWLAARLLPGRIGRGLADLGRGFAKAVTHRSVLGRQLALSLAIALANIAGFAFCVRAIGADLPVTAALALVPLILFTMLIPITVSGWGLREGAAAAILPVAGIAAAEGLAASVAFGLVFLTSSPPGAVALVLAPTAKAMKS